MFLVFIGSFTANNDLADIMVTLIFGFIGYFMVKFGWPRPPLVLGLTLGKIAENYLWISTAAYGAKWLLFPTVLILIAITVFTIAYPTIKERMGKAKYERPKTPCKAALRHAVLGSRVSTSRRVRDPESRATITALRAAS